MGAAWSGGCGLGRGYCDSDEELVPFRETGGEARVLIVALNYEYCPGYELTSSVDADAMLNIVSLAGAEDVTVVLDNNPGAVGFPTRDALLGHIMEVGGRCEPGDWFVWFYAGHGASVVDFSGDEADGMDEAFVTPTAAGQLTAQGLLVDDDFARALDSYVPGGVRILCINDCCHSDTICDIDSHAYRHEIYSLSAALDNEAGLDTGRGGVLTRALNSTIKALSVKHGREEFSIQEVFRGCRRRARKLSSAQELTLQFSGMDPSIQAWPLSFPWWEYLQGRPRRRGGPPAGGAPDRPDSADSAGSDSGSA